MASDRLSLFPLEHSYEQAEADLARMHRALTLAVIRLVDGGAPPTIAVGVSAAFAFTVGLAWLGFAVARSGHFPRWSGWLVSVAGPFIGLGFLVELVQPIGGLFLLASGPGIAWLGPRAGQRPLPAPFQPARSE